MTARLRTVAGGSRRSLRVDARPAMLAAVMDAPQPASWVLLAAGLLAATSAWLVRHPPRWPSVVALAGFAWSWIAGELVVWVGGAWILAGALAIAHGGLDAWPGWVGLAMLPAAALPWWWQRTDVRHLAAELARRMPGTRAPRMPGWAWLLFFWYGPRGVRRRRLRYGSRRAQVADVYTARAGPSEEGTAPMLLYVHGGGWVLGFRRWQGRILFRALLARGWTVVSMEYRLAPFATWPSHIIDVKRAIAWIRAHPELVPGDPARLAISGNSAGGHLATLAALTPGLATYQPEFPAADTSVAACLSFYGVYDILDRRRRWAHPGLKRLWELLIVKRSLARDPEVFRLASPLEHIADGRPRPPLMLVHGTHDSLVPPEGGADLATLAPEVDVLMVPGAQHAFDVFWSPRAILACEIAADWLDRAVRKPAPGHRGDAAPEA